MLIYQSYNPVKDKTYTIEVRSGAIMISEGTTVMNATYHPTLPYELAVENGYRCFTHYTWNKIPHMAFVEKKFPHGTVDSALDIINSFFDRFKTLEDYDKLSLAEKKEIVVYDTY
jgi:hypothetical protein